MRQITGKSYEVIGEELGGKHYSTVLYACKNISKIMDKNLKEKATIDTIIKNLDFHR